MNKAQETKQPENDYEADLKKRASQYSSNKAARELARDSGKLYWFELLELTREEQNEKLAVAIAKGLRLI